MAKEGSLCLLLLKEDSIFMLKPKRVLCIHDLSALGRASLSVIVPTLAATGCQPVMLPVSIFSVHTGGLGEPVQQDIYEYCLQTLERYSQMGEEFDCIYSGYLADSKQAALVQRAFDLWPHALHAVDPVLGDHGRLYSGVSPEMCEIMKKLCQQAQIIFPNSTEAAFLLNREPEQHCLQRKQAEETALELVQTYGCHVVLTGILTEHNKIANICGHHQDVFCVPSVRCERNYPGTGDLFAAATLGKLLTGSDLPAAVSMAGSFVSKAALASPSETRYGVWYEPFLSMLAPDISENTLNIVLVEPRIPQNTGNIARTCAATGAKLHLVGPMGFTIDDKKLKRAGLDYWHLLDITYYENLAEFFEKNHGPFYYFTTKAPARYCDISYPDGSYLVFGREDAGLPEELLAQNQPSCVRMPMQAEARSLNLSNTVAIGVYEVLRQWDFPGLCTSGHLQNYEWK